MQGSNVDLFFHFKTDRETTLSETAGLVYTALNITDYYEHESSHYLDEIYFKGENEDYSLKIAFEDDQGFEEYQYWVMMELFNLKERDLKAFTDQIAIRILQMGFKLALSLEDDPETDEEYVARILFELRRDSRDGISLKKSREVGFCDVDADLTELGMDDKLRFESDDLMVAAT